MRKNVRITDLERNKRYDVRVFDPRSDARMTRLYHRNLRKYEVEYIDFHPHLEIIEIIEKRRRNYDRRREN